MPEYLIHDLAVGTPIDVSPVQLRRLGRIRPVELDGDMSRCGTVQCRPLPGWLYD
ncbi:hypothetical protein NW756_009315 [Fusarium oxysporum]|nr:hypothetical protein NW758_013135 [Fusarium oxysporum]KAJ4041877.1 hypothetical protein NW763_012201 [Fusarium oxysporum]KAJ4084449.1 hypothetical protein NW756_009315 [Fusarium oxysporum]